MKHLKMLGLLAVAATTMMLLASSSSATTLTSPEGTALGVGATIQAESEGAIKLDGTITITCQKSTTDSKVTNAGGEGTAVELNVESTTFTECGSNTVSVKSFGTERIERTGFGTATVRSTGLTITVLTHNFLGTVHCIYKTNNTDMGMLTGFFHSGPRKHVSGAPIPVVPTDGFCSNDAQLTGTYRITTPENLDID